MQTKILFSFVLLIISIASSSQQTFYNTVTNRSKLPGKEPSFNLTVVPDKETTSFVLYVTNPEQKKITVQISHKTYGLAAETSFNTIKYSSRYNFDQADDGRYIITLSSGKERISKEVEINTVISRNVLIE